MFKQLYEKINALTSMIINNFDKQNDEHRVTREIVNKIVNNTIRDNKSQINNMTQTIKSQQRTIEQLTNALRDKYEHGLFIVSEDCKIPLVIRNGKEITNEMTSRFSIDWTFNELPMIEIEQFAGTDSSDVEE